MEHDDQESIVPSTLEVPADEQSYAISDNTVATEVGAIASLLRELLTASQEDPDRLLTVEELARLFKLSPRTLKDRAAAGAIAHHRFGKHYRFSRSDIAEILSSYAQNSRQPANSQRALRSRRAA